MDVELAAFLCRAIGLRLGLMLSLLQLREVSGRVVS